MHSELRVRVVAVLSACLLGLLQGNLLASTSPGAKAHVGAGELECKNGPLASPGTGKDLVVTGTCTVGAGTYNYGEINILAGGILQFGDTVTDFYAKSILIQNNGAMLAGVTSPDAPASSIVPIGTNGGKLTFHLYGAEQANKKMGVGVPCKKINGNSVSSDKTCGIPDTTTINMMAKTPEPPPTTCTQTTNLGGSGITDCFYMYDTMAFDNGGGNNPGFFGYKVIGLSYGGTLRLYGKKGATYADTVNPATLDPSNTATSWVRLDSCPDKATQTFTVNNQTVGVCKEGVLQAAVPSPAPTATAPNAATQIKLSAKVDWQAGDLVVITTTDYLVSHTEVRQIQDPGDGQTITLSKGLTYPHNASAFDVKDRIPAGRSGLTDLTSVDTRAAVGLLTRSIRIVSQGKNFMDPLPAANSNDDDRYFGGHMVVRQGFKRLQLQGVEMFQMGQGGKIGHYPIHFHMSRKVPTDTLVKDCSIWDSFTRWVVLHATQGVTLARNVGYRSIGHGYYLEDGTETDNKLYANLGVSALAAVDDLANERKVPGILVAEKHPDPIPRAVPYKTDGQNPTIFWLMNGWNDVEYNMAAGAEACGVCYWYVPGSNSGGSRLMNWTTNNTPYASEQVSLDHDGTTPIEKFLGNTCTTAMTGVTTIADVSPCNGVGGGGLATPPGGFNTIDNILVPKIQADINKETYYPIVHGGFRKATLCPAGQDCSRVPICGETNPGNCAVTTIDRFTTSFNYTETNFASIWLRPLWSLVINSAMTDIINGGISFVTGGGYTRSDTPRGLWLLARKSVFIGSSQSADANPFTSNAGPVNPFSGLECRNPKSQINFCIPADKEGSTADLGTVFQLSNHATNRFFSIYDGPSLQDSNVYLDITTTKLVDKSGNNACSPDVFKKCENSGYMEGRVVGIPGLGGDPTTKPVTRPSNCYLPNAAIAWKQPNGFFYPPAFHSLNLFFDDVQIRHYLIEPNFLPVTPTQQDPYKIDEPTSFANYCDAEPSMWTGFTSVDKQTELNDDDGSLTGLVKTISVNSNTFFQAPTEDFECKSDIPGLNAENRATAKTSPYDYVTSVVYPAACSNGGPDNCGEWKRRCTNNQCFGVPLYRELLVKGETAAPLIFMSGQATGQRSNLTPNNGRWYIDTTYSTDEQRRVAIDISPFFPNETYHVFVLFAKPNDQGMMNQTKETYDLFVGKGMDANTFLPTVHAETAQIPDRNLQFTSFDGDGKGAPWSGNTPVPGMWFKAYNPTTGMLTVTIDMSLKKFSDDYTNSIQGRCLPLSMCKWNGTAAPADRCTCNTDSTAYLPQDCKDNPTGICKWAIEDIDYPDGGAYGFSFTLPDETIFKYEHQPVPNQACLTAAANPEWNIPFQVPTDILAGDCAYKNSPPAPMFSSSVTPPCN